MRLLRSVIGPQRWGIGELALPGWKKYFKGGWGYGTGLEDHQVVLLTRGCARVSIAVQTMAAGATVAARSRRVVIGHSVRGRPIAARVLGPDAAPRRLLLVGCIHGNECAGTAILSALARRPVPMGVQLWLVAELNPDGTAAGTRQNAHGVDLNRNFPYRWERITDPS
jgi:predicted deacylase